MNDQEKQIIAGIFQRLEQTSGQSRDAEADRFIADKVRAQPYAPYAMAQALYVQEEALKSLGTQMEQLKAENERLSQQGSGGGGGILSSIFGGGGGRSQGSVPPSGPQGYGQQPGYASQQQGGPQQGGPWAGQQQGGPQQGPWGGQQQPQAAGGGGFLRGALTTAAGVAGGMVVGNALMSAFSGGGHSTLGNFSNTDLASMGAPLQGGDAGAGGLGDGGFQNAGWDDAGSNDATFQDASFDDGGDFGGGDDSSWS